MSGLSSIKTISNRLKNFMLAMAFFATQLLVPFIISGSAAAAASADLDQCRNGSLVAPVQCAGDGNGSTGWVNGNAGASNSHWREGDSIPYRLRLGGLASGAHTVTIEWDTTDSGSRHSIDYLTSFDRTEPTALPCSGITPASDCGAPTTYAIPSDPQVTGAGVSQIAGVFTLYGGTISSVSPYSYPDGAGFGANKTARISITFTATTAQPVLAWGGHIAAQTDWGSGHSAGAINGSSYHMRLINLDGKGGNQDRSLSAAAVFPTPSIVTQVSDDSVTVGDGVTDLATVTDPSNNPITVDGSVDFYLCGPLASTPTDTSCVTGGTKVGTTKTLSDGQATSDSYAVSAAGDYCFRAQYTPATTAPFSPQNHTNGTTECFHAEAPKGSITIVKDAVPNSAQDFSFTTTGLSTDQTGFKLDDDNDPTLSNTQTFTSLAAGDYGVTESATSGWDFDSVSCTQDASVSKNGSAITIHLAAGENVTCTYKNRQRGTITVHKVTDPANDTTPFSVTASTSDGNIAGNATRNDLATNHDVVYDVSQGSYSVDEAAASGWSEDDSDCASLTVSYNNLNVECTISNTKLAKLTIVKNTLPSSVDQDFSFTTTNLSGNFSLNASSNDTKVFSDLTPGQNYGVAEDGTSGWKLTGLSCAGINFTWDNISQGVSLNLPAGADVTCTFTNTQLGSITGTKFIVNSDKTLASDQALADGWEVHLCDSNNSCLTAYTDANGDYSFNDLLPDTYSIIEVLKDGWTQIFSPSSVDLTAGENSTDNNFGNFQNGSISGYKFNDLNGNGVKDDSEPKLSGWTINLYDDQDQLLASKVTDSTGYEFTNLAPGTYKVCEEGQAGWTQTSTPECYTVNIDMSGEQNLNIVFGNQGRGTLTVKKNVDTNGDGTVDEYNVSTWTWDLSGSYINDANYQDIATGATKSDLPVDTYSIHEDQKTNYHFVSVVCSDEDGSISVTQAETTSVDLAVGKNVVCTFTNARDTGGLILKKHVVNNDGGTASASDFTLHVKQNNADVVGSPAAGSESGTTYNGLLTGTYYVGEDTPVAGYTQTSIVCDGQATNEVVVTKDETKTCTITNDDIAPTLTLKKVVVNDNGGTAAANEWTLTAQHASDNPLIDEQGALNQDKSATTTQTTATAGVAYDLSENGPAGYSASDWSCDGGNLSNGAVTLGLGQNVTCTITNDDIAPTLTLKKIVVNDNGGTATQANFQATENTNPVDWDAATTVDANANYALDETVLTGGEGYSASDWTCGGGTQRGNYIVLGLAQNVTCTITNDDIAPQLVVVKKVKNLDTNLTKTSADFTMNVDGANVSDPSFPGSEQGTTVTLNAGDYNVTENADSDYTADFAGDCTGTIKVGETKYCYVENTAVRNPAIHVEKDGPASAYAGDTVTYTFTVTNPGNVPLSGVTVSDDVAGDGATLQSGDISNPGWLDPGETWIYTVNYKISASQKGDVVNTVIACGEPNFIVEMFDGEFDGQVDTSKVCDTDTHTTRILHVLGETTELPNTGQNPLLFVAAGLSFISLAFAVRFGSKAKSTL